jgi:hypothetical protein
MAMQDENPTEAPSTRVCFRVRQPPSTNVSGPTPPSTRISGRFQVERPCASSELKTRSRRTVT